MSLSLSFCSAATGVAVICKVCPARREVRNKAVAASSLSTWHQNEHGGSGSEPLDSVI